MRSRSHGLWVGPYAECSVERAHGELVHVGLAEDHDAGVACSRRTTVASYGGRQPSRIRDAAGGRHALRGDDVLERQRHAGQRAELLAGAALRVDPAGCGEAPSASTCRNAWTSAVDRRDPVEVRLGHLDGADLAAAIAAAVSAAVSRVRSAQVTPPRRGSAGPGTGRPRRRGRAGERLAPRCSAGRTTSGRVTLVSGTRVRGRRDVVGGDLGDPGDRRRGSRRAGRRSGRARRRRAPAGRAGRDGRPRRG